VGGRLPQPSIGAAAADDGGLKKGHDILRRYAPDGRLLQSFLNWDSFPPPAKINGHPDADAHLFGDDRRVAFLSVTAMELAVIDVASGRVERARLPEPCKGAWITGAGFAPRGGLVVSAQVREQGRTSSGLYEWQPESASWRSLPPPPGLDDEPWQGAVLGADGQGLWLSNRRLQVFLHSY